MRGRKPKNTHLKDQGKPGLTSLPLEATRATVGDEGASVDAAAPAPPADQAEAPVAAAPAVTLEPDDQAKGKRGGGQEPPDWMENEHARAEWRRVLPLMIQRRQYIGLFATELARYCVAFGQYVKAIQEVEKSGAVTKSSKGVKMLSQEWIVASRAHEIMAKIAADMGFNGVAQMRLAGSQLDLFDAPSRPGETSTPAAGNVVTGTPFGALRRGTQ